MQSVYREEVLGNNGLSGCRVDQAYTGYGCDRTDNRCEKEEPAEQDYRIGKFVTYVFDYGQRLVEPGLFCCSIGVFAHTETSCNSKSTK